MTQKDYRSRRTCAIISHPDAGKTTLTEMLLLHGGAVHLAGAVKSRKADRHATSDWLALEKERGISVNTSVMQFPYADTVINLLDTPGHADFSEDTYRTLTAVDFALMVIDCAKGVEARTIKLLQICRMRRIPIMTFINKVDREALPPLDLLEDIEQQLGLTCCPLIWPCGSGQRFEGLYDLQSKTWLPKPDPNDDDRAPLNRIDCPSLDPADWEKQTGHCVNELSHQMLEELELLVDAFPSGLDMDAFLAGKQTPVFFGSALRNTGVIPLLDAMAKYAPCPTTSDADKRPVEASESKLTGFVFKIQANIDSAHRSRIAFLRLCSGEFKPGIKVYHVGQKKNLSLNQVTVFLADQKKQAEFACAGDIIGIHNAAGLKIGDTLTQGESLSFLGIPSFAPEIFREVVLKDPMKRKALNKGLQELAEEGAVQFFKPLFGNQLILGAVGLLQFDVVAYRLAHEYKVECVFEACGIQTVRWLDSDDIKQLEDLKHKHSKNLAYDAHDQLVYLPPSMAHLHLTQEAFNKINFFQTSETQSDA